MTDTRAAFAGAASPDLTAWGWAPGLYDGMTCKGCKTRIHWADKRSWQCYACALKDRDAEVLANAETAYSFWLGESK